MLGALVAGVGVGWGESHYDTYFEGNCGHSFQVVTPSLLENKTMDRSECGCRRDGGMVPEDSFPQKREYWEIIKTPSLYVDE